MISGNENTLSHACSITQRYAENYGVLNEFNQILQEADWESEDVLGPDPFKFRAKNYGKKPDMLPISDDTIHYIWFGSKLPDKYVKKIYETHCSNLKRPMILWTEDASIQPQIPGVTLVNIFDFFQNDDALILETYIRYELARPQYAAASDMLRIEILHKFGGLYLDCDMSLKEGFPYFYACSSYRMHSILSTGTDKQIIDLIYKNKVLIPLHPSWSVLCNHCMYNEKNTTLWKEYFTYIPNAYASEVFFDEEYNRVVTLTGPTALERIYGKTVKGSKDFQLKLQDKEFADLKFDTNWEKGKNLIKNNASIKHMLKTILSNALVTENTYNLVKPKNSKPLSIVLEKSISGEFIRYEDLLKQIGRLLNNTPSVADRYLKELAEYHSKFVLKHDCFGHTPLFNFVLLASPEQCTVERFNKLVELGFDPQKLSSDKSTLLHAACYARNVELAKYLLTLGFKTDALTDSKQTMFSYYPENAAFSPSNDDVELWDWLKENGVDINLQSTPCGNTALHEAVNYNDTYKAAWLLKNGANKLLTNDIGIRPEQNARSETMRNLFKEPEQNNAVNSNKKINLNNESTCPLQRIGLEQSDINHDNQITSFMKQINTLDIAMQSAIDAYNSNWNLDLCSNVPAKDALLRLHTDFKKMTQQPPLSSLTKKDETLLIQNTESIYTVIVDFVHIASTPQTGCLNLFPTPFGETRSAIAFYNAMKNEAELSSSIKMDCQKKSTTKNQNNYGM